MPACPVLPGNDVAGALLAAALTAASLTSAPWRKYSLALSVSSFHLFWSQSARYYAAQSLFVLLAFLALSPRNEGRVGERPSHRVRGLARLLIEQAGITEERPEG